MSPAQPGTAITDCTLLYAAAVSDPFGAPVGACIPDGDVRDSFRTKVWARGTCSADPAGVAFVAFNPYAGVTRDIVSICFTTGLLAVAGGAVEGSGAGIGQSFTNSLFTDDTFGQGGDTGSVNNAGFRPVSWGLRMRPTTAELNLQGTVLGYTAGADLTSINGLTYAAALGFQEVEAVSVSSSRRWITVRGTTFMTSGATDTPGDYVSSFSQATVTDGGNLVSAIIFQGEPAMAATFEYEVVAHYEVDGTMPGKEPSHCDPIGLAVANAQTATASFRAAREVSEAPARAFVSMMYDHLSSGVSGLLQWASPKVKTAAKEATLAALAAIIAV